MPRRGWRIHWGHTLKRTSVLYSCLGSVVFALTSHPAMSSRTNAALQAIRPRMLELLLKYQEDGQ
eukprot:722992-Pyramimonas_sp.AAC.1